MFLNFINRWIFNSNDVYPFILQWWVTIAMIGTFVSCFFLIIKRPLGFNKKIQNRTWLVLGILILLFLIINLSFNSFRPADEEWGSVYSAKTMINGNKMVYIHDNSGIVFPLLAAGLLKISNFHIPLIRIFNIILGTISLFLIFECAYLLFNNEKASLLSVFVYAITPWAYRYTGILFGLPTLVQFLSLLSLLAILLAFKYHKFSLHLLSLVSLLVLNQTKLEYFSYYFIYLIVFFIIGEYKKIKKKELIVFIVIAFLCFIPAVLKSALFKISYLANPSWCGYLAQTAYAKHSYGIIITGIDHILQRSINMRIALSYFLEDLPVFFKFWSQPTLILPIVLAIMGIFLSFKKYYRKKLFLWFPIIFFLGLATGYLFDCGWYEARHAISAYGFLAIFSGYGLWRLLTKSKTRGFFALFKTIFPLTPSKISKATKYFIYLGVFCLILLQCFFCFQKLRSYREDIQNSPFKFQSYYLYENFMKNISNQSAFFITVDNSEKYILRILGYQTESFSNCIKSNNRTMNYEKTIHDLLVSNDFNYSDKLYFIKSPACGWFNLFASFCNESEKRSKYMLKETYYGPKELGNKLQLFLLKE